MITLTVIGCGDAVASGGIRNTCFCVQAPSGGFLIDCGASAVPGLKQHNIKLDDINTILLTHFHGDHYGGVPFLLLEAAIYGRVKPLTIAAPAGAKDKIAQLLHLLYPGTQVLEKLDVRFIEYMTTETISMNKITLKAFKVIHSPESLPHGLRITVDEKVIAYSGDTEWTDALIALSDNADLFICECNFFDLQIKNHMNYTTLKTKLPQLNCKQLLLTHFDNEMLQNIEKVEVACAKDGMVKSL